MKRRKSKPAPIKLYSVVMVWWKDATSDPGWKDRPSLETALLASVLACGFLVHRNSTRIVLATVIAGEGDAGNCFMIPCSQIVKIKVLMAPTVVS